MGNWFQKLADVDAHPDEASSLAVEITDWLVLSEVVEPQVSSCVLSGLGHAPGPRYASVVTEPDEHMFNRHANGLEVTTGRTVFFGGQSGIERISCPRCEAAASWDDVSDTIDTWFAGGDDQRTCSSCQWSVGLNSWRWVPPWGFGFLGFTFWNWPELRPSFLAELSTRLGGHRVVHVADKL